MSPLRPNNILQNLHFRLEVIAFNYPFLNPFDAEPTSDQKTFHELGYIYEKCKGETLATCINNNSGLI